MSARSTTALSPLLPAGFYYKTFMWPRAALGAALRAGDPRAPPASAARRSGPIPTATCTATPIATCWSSAPARPASPRRWPPRRAGARVILCDEQAEFGGALLAETDATHRRHAGRRLGRRDAWRRSRAAERVTLLPRTTAFGYYAAELHRPRRARHRPSRRARPEPAARAAVAGAGEARSCSPPAPSSGRWCSPTTTGRASCWPTRRGTYLNRYGVMAGHARGGRHRRRRRLRRRARPAAGRRRRSRRSPISGRRRPATGVAAAREARHSGAAVDDRSAGTHGRLRVKAATLGAIARERSVAPARDARLRPRADVGRLDAERASVLAVARQACATTTTSQAFVPGHVGADASARPAPAAAPTTSPTASPRATAAGETAAATGTATGRAPSRHRRGRAARRLHRRAAAQPRRARSRPSSTSRTTSPPRTSSSRSREGFRSIEHVKRYTTTGMATDQGKTSNMNALAIVAGDAAASRSRRSA